MYLLLKKMQTSKPITKAPSNIAVITKYKKKPLKCLAITENYFTYKKEKILIARYTREHVEPW